ncbi:MAG: hypothetical protein H0U92_06045 [Actinobacteria bacterium]|nr:hypothetical protein [Actinomycetota bacterium]
MGAPPEPASAGRGVSIPPQVRQLVNTFTKVALPRIAKARRPRDLKALARDPDLISALARELTPLIDGAMRYALPIKGRWPTHLSATVAGAVGPAAANLAEGLVLAGPETLTVTAPTALGVQFAAATWETYLKFSTIVQKLRDAGITDPDAVQLAIVRMVIPDATGITKTMIVKATERLVERMLARAATGWIPLAGPILGAVGSNFDMHGAHRAADSVIRERKAAPPGECLGL